MSTIDFYIQGQRIDQYRVVKLLNTTATSHLYLVQNEHAHKQQVLKLYAGSCSNTQASAFINQAKLLQAFSAHANIVDVVHVGMINNAPSDHQKFDSLQEAGERPFLVMPHYPHSLNDLLALHQQRLSFVTSLHMVNQVIDALQALHSKGVLHLDIKPHNILLDEKNSALLADFGCAFILDNSPLASHFSSLMITCIDDANQYMSGTLDYASPEQKRAILEQNGESKTITAKSDMYSLGLLWYRLLTGKFVLGDTETSQQCGQATIASDLENIAPEWAGRLITELLSPDPSARPDANICKSRILQEVSAPEVNQTIAITTRQTPSSLKPSFSVPKGFLFRYILPLLAIIIVLVYWFTVPSPYEPFTQKESSSSLAEGKEAALKEKQAISQELSKQSLLENSEGLHTTEEMATKQARLATNKEFTPHFSEVNFSASHGVYLLKGAVNRFANTTFSNSAENTQIISNHNKELKIEWRIMDALPNAKVMTTEVSNALFAMCVEEGACKHKKKFSTSAIKSLAFAEKSNYPKVNIDWYEVTEQFIPWLNNKTNKFFSLPSRNQWLALHPNIQAQISKGVAIHCKNCKHKLARQHTGVTMPVDAVGLKQDGMYHSLGNVQEWLDSCWQEKSADGVLIQRCDQAIVAGGSWLSQQSEISQQPLKRLLKTAKTPTTGFRLLEIIND